MKISSKLYNIIKYISTIAIPALVAFLTVIGQTLDLSWMPTVVTILGAFGLFLGELIRVSSKEYWKDKEVTNAK